MASRFRCRSCERGYIFPRAPEQFVASPLCLVGYVRWDARSDRVPPLQTIIFSSFTGRTPVTRLHVHKRGPTEKAPSLEILAHCQGSCTMPSRCPHPNLPTGQAATKMFSGDDRNTWANNLQGLVQREWPVVWPMSFEQQESVCNPLRSVFSG